jgi:hypothetical protein
VYIKVRDIVSKCTEKSEGIRVYEKCQYSLSENIISIDFDGVMQVTDEFVFALLGEIAKQDKTVINRIQYVRIQTYIKTRFKRASKRLA